MSRKFIVATFLEISRVKYNLSSILDLHTIIYWKYIDYLQEKSASFMQLYLWKIFSIATAINKQFFLKLFIMEGDI